MAAPTPSRRDTRRAETARRIRWAALELTREKTFDGWTMDELAERAEVSRRTLFNYFDSKADVVLGPEHDDLRAELTAAIDEVDSEVELPLPDRSDVARAVDFG